MNKNDFCTLEGWIETFKKKGLINLNAIISGEISNDTTSVNEFISKLKLLNLCAGHQPEQIFNTDETALF